MECHACLPEIQLNNVFSLNYLCLQLGGYSSICILWLDSFVIVRYHAYQEIMPTKKYV